MLQLIGKATRLANNKKQNYGSIAFCNGLETDAYGAILWARFAFKQLKGFYNRQSTNIFGGISKT